MNPAAVLAKLHAEIQLGRITGPFADLPFHPCIVNPIGLVAKKEPGQYRLIHHLSYPLNGDSVNLGIPPEMKSVRYSTIDDAVKCILFLGPGCLLSKTDIQDSYRLIPIHPSDYPLLAIQYNGMFYVDKCLQMGCASACKIFDTFSSSLRWIAQHKLGIQHSVHLLDDFLFVQSPELPYNAYLSSFLRVCEEIGVPISHKKTVSCTTKLTFLGIELDTVTMQARLDQEKLNKCISQITLALNKKKIKLRDLQSLIGLLNFCCCVLRPGRAFLRRLIDLTIGISRPHHYLWLTRSAKADLKMWQNFLRSYNGCSFFLGQRWLTSESLHLFTDASSKGYGATFGSKWFYGRFPISWQSINIVILEAFPIAVALGLWGKKLSNSCVLFHTDNEALVSVLNKQTSKEPQVMLFIRYVVLQCLTHNILFRSEHIRSTDNIQADLLSRFQIQQFRDSCPDADIHPTPIPAHLLPEAWVKI